MTYSGCLDSEFRYTLNRILDMPLVMHLLVIIVLKNIIIHKKVCLFFMKVTLYLSRLVCFHWLSKPDSVFLVLNKKVQIKWSVFYYEWSVKKLMISDYCIWLVFNHFISKIMSLSVSKLKYQQLNMFGQWIIAFFSVFTVL
jgi:hypothetical protein